MPGAIALLLDEPDLAIEWLREAVRRLHASGVRGASGAALSTLGRAYIETGRWDDALAVAAEAADLAEAYQMDIVAACADAITAAVLAMRAESDEARAFRGYGNDAGRPGREPVDFRGYGALGSPRSPTAVT